MHSFASVKVVEVGAWGHDCSGVEICASREKRQRHREVGLTARAVQCSEDSLVGSHRHIHIHRCSFFRFSFIIYIYIGQDCCSNETEESSAR